MCFSEPRAKVSIEKKSSKSYLKEYEIHGDIISRPKTGH